VGLARRLQAQRGGDGLERELVDHVGQAGDVAHGGAAREGTGIVVARERRA
jgi:hypothetical protein